MTDYVLVLTTTADERRATAMATALVEEALAACVSISAPMRSTYRWQGRIEHAAERQLIIKTSRTRLGDLERRLQELHDYELPELLVVPIESGSAAYLTWLGEGVTPDSGH
jgi:periplasmic divalent cation tolerance protein